MPYPQKICEKYGADTARWFVLSDSPPERDMEWTTSGVEAAWKHLNKVWRLVAESINTNDDNSEKTTDLGLEKAVNNSINEVTKNIENFSFNKAIANLYDLTNIISKATVNPFTKRKALKSLAVLMMPFTPHIAEEMWLTLGGQGLISQSSWPNVNQELLENEDITIAVQINGKRRTLITYPKSLEKKEIESLALSNENIKKILGGKDPKKVIVIPGRIVNVVF